MIEKKQATWANIKANGRSAEELARLDAEVEREAEAIRNAAVGGPTPFDGVVGLLVRAGWVGPAEELSHGRVRPMEAADQIRRLMGAPLPELDIACIAALEALTQGIAAPADDRGFLDPPDLGRLRPAEEAAREAVETGKIGPCIPNESSICWDGEWMVRRLVPIIKQARAEGAAEAMRAVADVADACEMAAEENQEVAGCEAVDGHHDRAKTLAAKGEAYAGIAKMLRSLHPASVRGFIEPPDMGRPNAVSETASEIRGRIALPPGADRGFIEPPDLGKPGDVGFIEPPDMGRSAGILRAVADALESEEDAQPFDNGDMFSRGVAEGLRRARERVLAAAAVHPAATNGSTLGPPDLGKGIINPPDMGRGK